MRRSLPLVALILSCLCGIARADNSFDLAGPKVDVHVKRGDITLPISEAPNLLPGDRLWIHPDFPESQSAHYVLVVAFLRGATNPPPPEWFTRVETWSHEARDEGVFVTVPQEAQQAIIFLAPETGGDFSTLRKAVHDRPGAFVRATQDLQAASWDRMRLEAYLAEVKVNSQTDTKSLKEKAELTARSLGIKIEQQCFDKPTDQQAPCLVQHTDGIVLDDSNVQSLVTQISNGSAIDLMNQLSYSNTFGGGGLSPYVGAIVDTARILASLHTAHFQYIPALALPIKDTLNLRLNVPPSFRDPKSVVVVALPPIGPSKTPPLHPLSPPETLCAQKPGLVFAAEGAPLVYATPLAHDLALHIESAKGPIDIPVKAEPSKGGLVPTEPLPALPQGELTGVVRGKWGFDDWEGPRFHIVSSGPGSWIVTPDDQSALVVGRNDQIHIQGGSTLCVQRVSLAGDEHIPLSWKAPSSDALEISIDMKNAAPGSLSLQIHQYGVDQPDVLKLNAYVEAASLDHLTLNAGDHSAMLKGTRLDEVAQASFAGTTWKPVGLARVHDFDQLTLTTVEPTQQLQPSGSYTARVSLRDGRDLKVPVSVETARPQVTLLSKGAQDDGAFTSPVHLGSTSDLPLTDKIVFFVRSLLPEKFPRTSDVEVAAEDGSFRTVLSLSDGSLMLEDARTALGVVEPLARFGTSAFGPLRARVVSADGVAGDWLNLGTLVRLPVFKDLHCPHVAAKPCILTGSNLFLLDSVSSSEDFSNPTSVPADFTGAQVAVPHPASGVLYLKLRDDPETVQSLTLPVSPLAPANSGTPTTGQLQPGISSPVQPQPNTTSQSQPPPSPPPARTADPPATPKPE